MKVPIDTNVFSEPLKPAPAAEVIGWLRQLDETQSFVSVISFAEIRHGIASRPDGKRKARLTEWLDVELRDRFAGRIVPIDQDVARAWGDITSASIKRGHNIGAMDCFIAATAVVHKMAIATRNHRDFRDLGIDLFDPWSS